jgi:hypothetical protein
MRLPWCRIIFPQIAFAPNPRIDRNGCGAAITQIHKTAVIV